MIRAVAVSPSPRWCMTPLRRVGYHASDELQRFVGKNASQDRNRLQLVALAVWLLGETGSTPQNDGSAVLALLDQSCSHWPKPVRPANASTTASAAANSRATCLPRLDYRPTGESLAQATDRLSALSSTERKRLLQESHENRTPGTRHSRHLKNGRTIRRQVDARMNPYFDPERYPALTEDGARMLKFLREHPQVPVYRNESGNRLTPEDLEQLAEFERTLRSEQRRLERYRHRAGSALSVGWVYREVPFTARRRRTALH